MHEKKRKYAIILGATGSFGFASAKKLAEKGFNLILIYRERKSALEKIRPEIDKIRKISDIIEFNANINDDEKRDFIIRELANNNKFSNNISFMLHAVADGNLNPLFNNEGNPNLNLSAEDLIHTINSMGTNLNSWTKLFINNELFCNKASVLGLTSEGTRMVFKDYAAVAAAKSVMETNVRYIAVELAKKGIRANIINAGITDSKALKVFPDYENFICKAKNRNPQGRLTMPDDVAKVVAFMASEDSGWINGTIITVDGGEQLISIF